MGRTRTRGQQDGDGDIGDRIAKRRWTEAEARTIVEAQRRSGVSLAAFARRHRLSERFLCDVLGLGWAEAHEEAHRFEHGMTPVIEEKIFELLGHPKTCPHGSPIPGTGYTLSPDLRPLDSFQVGAKARIEFISEELEEDLELLRYLERHDLRPGHAVEVQEKVLSAGLLVLRGDRGEVALGLQVASRIKALPVG